MVVVPDSSHSRNRFRTPWHSVQGSVPRVTVTVEAMPPRAAVISLGEDPPVRIAISAHRLPA